MRSVLQTIAVAALFAFSSALLIADDQPVVKVDPLGEPKNISKGNALRYFLWVDAEGCMYAPTRPERLKISME